MRHEYSRLNRVNSSYDVAWRYPIPRHRLGGLKTGCPSSCLVWLSRCQQNWVMSPKIKSCPQRSTAMPYSPRDGQNCNR
jgi:hypothetical protein